jgi:ATP-dependent Clp protease ATP-binding subunit ClpC
MKIRIHSSTKKSILKKYTVNLNERAAKNKIDPVIGRDKELYQLTSILLKRRKNNPLLIGEAGVGKTAIVEDLARRIYDKTCHHDLLDKTVLMLDTPGILSGTAERGEYETRITALINEIKEHGNIILLIDEIHSLVSQNNSSKSTTTSHNTIVDMLKPGLARGEISCIGATTFDEYIKYLVKDTAFERRFQIINVDEPEQDTNLDILYSLKPIYEEYHKCHITDDACITTIELCFKYLYYRQFPDKAIDILDEACSKVVLNCTRIPNASRVVTSDDIFDVVSIMTGIPLKNTYNDDYSKIMKTEDYLKNNIIGQNHAIDVVINTLKRFTCGFSDKNRPVASFMFVGPTGTGKTELVKLLGEKYFNSNENIIRFDMSEYQDPYTISSLIGSPPGYVGFEEGGTLTKQIKRKPYSIVLFDEIEKAHHKIFDILLQIIEDAVLTDNYGKTYSFKNAIIVMTSNIGFSHSPNRTLGFDLPTDNSLLHFEQQQNLLNELKYTFRPEFLNRIDSIVYFKYLSLNDIQTIADSMISASKKDILNKYGIYIEIKKETLTKIYQSGMNSFYGARPLKRAIDEHILDVVTTLILEDNISPSGIVKI